MCYCDTPFSENSKLNGHIESVHEEKKPFICNICNYKCYHKPSLRRHVESGHEGKKPFKFI
jgi:uncharacterized Zn-finger protein